MKLARTMALVPILASGAARAEPPPLPAMTLGVDGGVVRRTTLWRDDLFGTLRDYRLGGAPAIGVDLVVFPGAFFTDSRLAWIGFAGRVEALLGIDSRRTQHDASLPTRAGSFAFSLRGRLPLAWGAVWLDAGVGSRSFVIQGEGITTPDFPSVRHIGPRAALGAEIRLPAGFTVAPRGALSRWITTGDLGSAAWFPHNRTWGAELGVRASFWFHAPFGFSPYVDLSWSRDVSALRPQPGEARIAGGLADDRFAARGGFTIQFPSGNERRR